MTSLDPLSSSFSTARMLADTRRTPLSPVRDAGTMLAPTTPSAAGIAAQVDGKVNQGALSAEQAGALKDFFDTGGSGASTGSLMRTASAQLDQFDRVLEKLRANLSGGATYGGGGAGGSSGLVVDRLA